MGAVAPVRMVDRASVSVARERVRAVAADAGLSTDDAERLALAVSELAQNQLDHARDGVVEVREVQRDGVRGVEIAASDRGPGIGDPAGVLDGRVLGKGLGVGLQSVRRMAEELDLEVRRGEGTTVVARRFAGPVRRQPEVVVVGRGLAAPSGDVAVVARAATGLLLAVIDGAGHGAAARRAAELAAVEVRPGRSPVEVLERMGAALVGTRGAAAVVAWVEPVRAVVEVAGTGNVGLRVFGPDGEGVTHRSSPGLLGARGVPGEQQTLPFPPGSLLLAWTDGLSRRADARPWLGRSIVHLAQHLADEHATGRDDVLVLAAR